MVHYLKSIYNHVAVEKGVFFVEDYKFGIKIALKNHAIVPNFQTFSKRKPPLSWGYSRPPGKSVLSLEYDPWAAHWLGPDPV